MPSYSEDWAADLAALTTAAGEPFTADDKSKLPASTGAGTKVSRIPHWEESPEAYERVILKGVTLPGSATVTGDGYKRRVDRKKTAGQHGETTTDLGQDAAEIEVTVELWTPDQLADFHAMVKRVLAHKTRPVKTTVEVPFFEGSMDAHLTSTRTIKKEVTTLVDEGPGPVDIYYPTLALFGITKVQVLTIGLPTPKGAKDAWTVRLKCRQYIAQKAGKVTTNEKPGSYSKRLGGNAFEGLAAHSPSKTTTGPGYFVGGGGKSRSPEYGGNGATGTW